MPAQPPDFAAARLAARRRSSERWRRRRRRRLASAALLTLLLATAAAIGSTPAPLLGARHQPGLLKMVEPTPEELQAALPAAVVASARKPRPAARAVPVPRRQAAQAESETLGEAAYSRAVAQASIAAASAPVAPAGPFEVTSRVEVLPHFPSTPLRYQVWATAPGAAPVAGPSIVPEPATGTMLLLGLAGLAWAGRRRERVTPLGVTRRPDGAPGDGCERRLRGRSECEAFEGLQPRS